MVDVTQGDTVNRRETAVQKRPARPRKCDGLLARLALLLSFVLLPIGAIAVVQTTRALEAAEETYRSTLEAQTARIATPEREAINVAIGTARTLAGAIASLDPGIGPCNALVQRTVAENEWWTFVGYLDENAMSVCNSVGEPVDFSDAEMVDRLYAAKRAEVVFNPQGEVSGQAVVVVIEPVVSEAGVFRGFVSVAFPAWALQFERNRMPALEGMNLVTFNGDGEVLTSDLPHDLVWSILPSNFALPELVGSSPRSFVDTSQGGDARIYSVVPIATNLAYALGSWQPKGRLAGFRDLNFSTIVAFPILMWLMSIAVALFSIHRLVVRPVSELGRRMRSFADGRRILKFDVMKGAPTELRDIGQTFELMASKIVRDEADLENRLHEREVLLKEVHHRVKNNLQLMSSIMNMQTRRARTQEARSALRNVQDRLTSLATVHRGLYEAPELSVVRIDELVRELLGQLQTMGLRDRGITVDQRLEPVTLVPDQAAPLAMLTTEAFTNALKYVAPDADGQEYIRVVLCFEAEDRVLFEIVNSVDPEVDQGAREPAQGLGQQLIAAFVQQLDGTSEQETTPGRYTVRLRFTVEPFAPA